VVGHSSGAAVAAQLALDKLDRVHTLSLLELSLPSIPAAQAFLEQAAPVLETYASGDHETALAMFLATVSGMAWDDCGALLDSRVPGMVVQVIKDAKTVFEAELPGVAQWQFGVAEAARIRRPTLSILGGETLPLWIEVAAFLRTTMPYVEERAIAGVGHLLHLQQPAPVAQAITEFLDGNRMAAQG
jgi:3-oxoadipate enol-lactonase